MAIVFVRILLIWGPVCRKQALTNSCDFFGLILKHIKTTEHRPNQPQRGAAMVGQVQCDTVSAGPQLIFKRCSWFVFCCSRMRGLAVVEPHEHRLEKQMYVNLLHN